MQRLERKRKTLRDVSLNSDDSILQVTKDTVNQSNNYYDYIINQNNTLYKKQLPLLMKNSRMNALVLSKTKSDFQLNTIQKNKEEENNKSNTKINKFLSPLNNIRNLQIRSKKFLELNLCMKLFIN